MEKTAPKRTGLSKGNHSSVKDLIKACTQDATLFPDDTDVIPLDHEYLNSVLDRITKEMEAGIARTQRMREALAANEEPICNNTFPTGYINDINRVLSSLEGLITTVCDNTEFDCIDVWHYIATSQKAGEPQILIRQASDLILIRMPYMPRRGKGNKSIVNRMLAAALGRVPPFPVWPKWHASFYHVFPTSVEGVPKDVDNYDYKKTIDLISFYLGTSDNALNFDMSMRSVFTNEVPQGVYILVTQKSSENSDFINKVVSLGLGASDPSLQE